MLSHHLHTIFLALLSLVMAGYIAWPITQPETPTPTAPDWEVKGPMVDAASVPLSLPTPKTPSESTPRGPSDTSLLQMPVPFLSREASSGPGPAPVDAQELWVTTGIQPPPVAHSPESLSYLAEIAFGVEYGDSAPVLHKWTEDVYIKVHGTPTRADLEALDQVVAELNQLLRDVHLQVTDRDANLEIYFLPESRFSSVEPEYVPVNLGFFRVWWDNAGAINRGRILITSQDITQQERSHLIREELTQSLGLFKDSWQYPDSMFYQGWTDVTNYSDLDQDIVHLLYSPQLRPGMTQSQVLDALGVDPSALCCHD